MLSKLYGKNESKNEPKLLTPWSLTHFQSGIVVVSYLLKVVPEIICPS